LAAKSTPGATRAFVDTINMASFGGKYHMLCEAISRAHVTVPAGTITVSPSPAGDNK